MKTFPTILKAVAAVAAGLLLFSCTKKAELSVSPKSLTFSADIIEAQPQTVTVTTNTAWRASVSENWLSISPVSGPESGSFTVSVVNFNKELTDRTAKITVVADDLIEEITVTQKAIVPVLQVETNGWDLNTPIPAKGAARQLNVTCNVPWTLTVTGGGDWFVYGPESGNDNSYVTLGWHGNFDFEPRTVKLVFSAAGKEASLSLTQLAAEPSRQIDSLALVAIYNASDGAKWKASRAWHTEYPLGGKWTDPEDGKEKDAWPGVKVNTDGRVIECSITNGTVSEVEWELPKDIAKMTELQTFQAVGSKVKGEFPEFLYGMKKLSKLRLNGNNITGSLSAKIGDLTELTELFINENADFGGTIPVEVAKLKKLNNINIAKTAISGAVPAELSDCDALATFVAYQCGITSIPDNFDKWPVLKTFMIYGNNIEAPLPESLSKCKTLVSAQMYNCNFTGNIPESYGDLPSTCNQLYLNGNKLQGVVPAKVQSHPNFNLPKKWNAVERILPQQEGYGLTLE